MPRSKVLRSRLLQAQELLHLLAEVMMPRHRVLRHTSAHPVADTCPSHLFCG